MARYSVNWTYSGYANLFKNVVFNASPGTERDQNFVIDYTRTQNPTTVIDLRAGLLRVSSMNDPASTGFNATSLGLPAYMTANTGTMYFPQFQASPYTLLGTAGWQVMHRHEGSYQYQGSVTKIKGGHTIKAGAEYRSLYENYFQPAYPGGQFTFNRKQTGLNPLSSSSSQGDALASALVGWGNGGAVTVDYPTANSSGYAGVYMNDDWRVSRKLTINFGLRWDADIPRVDRFNRINWMDLSAPSPIADNPQVKVVFPNLLGAMQFATPSNRTPYNGD